MENERILAYQLAQKIPDEEIKDISGAGHQTNGVCGEITHDAEIWRGRKPHLTDTSIDVSWDL